MNCTRTYPFQWLYQLFASFHKKKTDICTLARDTTLYTCGKNLDAIVDKLELETNTAIIWRKDNKMVAISSKFYFIFLSKHKNNYTNMSFVEKPLNHVIHLNYSITLQLPLIVQGPQGET